MFRMFSVTLMITLCLFSFVGSSYAFEIKSMTPSDGSTVSVTSYGGHTGHFAYLETDEAYFLVDWYVDGSLKDYVLGGCWMGNDWTLLLQIKKDWESLTANFEIYRYDLVSRRLTNLTNHPGVDHGSHWINGTLAVSPAGKLSILWGQLKQVD